METLEIGQGWKEPDPPSGCSGCVIIGFILLTVVIGIYAPFWILSLSLPFAIVMIISALPRDFFGPEAKILLTEEGLRLHYGRFYKWEDIKSFKFEDREGESGSVTIFYLYFHNGTNTEFQHYYFEKTPTELASLFEAYMKHHNGLSTEQQPQNEVTD